MWKINGTAAACFQNPKWQVVLINDIAFYFFRRKNEAMITPANECEWSNQDRPTHEEWKVL